MGYSIKLIELREGQDVDEALGADTREKQTVADRTVTYNFSPFFRQAFASRKGLLVLDRKGSAGASALLNQGILSLSDDAKRPKSSWEPTPGNAKQTLEELLELAQGYPEATRVVSR